MFFFLPYLVDVPMHRWPIANWILILVTCIISIGMFPQVHRWEQRAAGHIQYSVQNGHIAESYVAGNARHQTINYFLEQPGNFKISQLVGSLFLHAGWMHLLGNMFFLWLFGNAVNAKLGHWQFLALYFLAGIFAGGIYLIFGPAIPVLGASGAIMGVMGAFFMLYPRNDVSCAWGLVLAYGVKSISCYWLLGAYFLLDLWGTLSGGGAVAHVSHVAGFTFGAAVLGVLLWRGWVVSRASEENILQVLHLQPLTPPPTRRQNDQ